MEENDIKKSLRLYNINETADILGISTSKFFLIRKEKEFTNLKLVGKYYSIEDIKRIKDYIIYGY